jgi:hypothetical protein
MLRRDVIKRGLAALLGGYVAVSLMETALAACSEASCPTTRRRRCCGGRCLQCPVDTTPTCVVEADNDVIAKCCNAQSQCTTMYRVNR